MSKRLKQGDIGKAARIANIPTAVLLAFLEVEANGRGFDSRGRVKILPEAHIFFKYLPKNLKQKAVEMGIAYPRWRPGKYNFDKYKRFNLMIKLNEFAAYMSVSYGLGQIMGFNHKAAGHSSAKEMYETAKQGEYEQLVQLVNLLVSWKMDKMLKHGLDFTNPNVWIPAVKKYNGPGFRKNKYHIKAANAYKKHAGLTTSVVNRTSSNILRIGVKSEKVRNLQIDLQRLGYKFKSGIDGRFGPETEAHVKKFQSNNNLAIDGIAGKRTLAKIKKNIDQLTVDKHTLDPVFDKEPNWLTLLMEFIQGLLK